MVDVDELISDSETESNGFLGHVTASEGLSVGRQESEIRGYVRTSYRDHDVRIGDYVEVEIGDDRLFAEVLSLDYEMSSPIDDMDDIPGSLEDIEESDYPQQIELDPITILRGDDLERGVVDRIPKPFEKIYLVDDRDVLYRGLNIPRDGISLGHVAVSGDPVPRSGDPLVYHLRDPDPSDSRNPMLWRHLLIAGTTGKGKTHLSKNLLRQIYGRTYETAEEIPLPICLCLLDPDNEYAELSSDPESDVSEWERQGWKTGGVSDVVSYVPVDASSDTPSTDAPTQKEFGIPFELVRGREQMLTTDASGQTEHAIYEMLRGYFSRRSRGDATYRDFVSWTDTARADYVGEGTVHEASWDAAVRRLRKTHFEEIFDRGPSSLLDLEDEIFTPGRVSVIPTSHLDGRREYFVVMFFVSYVIDNKIASDPSCQTISQTPLLLGLDEAHNYLSGASTGEQERLLRRFVEAAKQGRKSALSLYLISQNPEDIADPILKQTNTRIYLGLESEVVDGISVPGDRDLSLFDRGQLVVKAPDSEPTEVRGLPDCLVRHSS